MLRKIRLVLALLCLILVSLLFLDFTGTIHSWFGWLVKVQFLPAVLALNVSVVAVLVVFTLLLGRVYCSVICPLGVMQDIVAWLGKRRKKLPYTYSPALSGLRYGVLGLFIIALIAGMGSLVALLEPYSAYGRIASNLFAPLYQFGNNLFACVAERMDSYTFYSVEVWMKTVPTFIIAVLTLVVLVVLSWRNGRSYCNTICPVGTVLGFLSRYSLFRITIDAKKCNQCNLCSSHCKAACINTQEHRIDYSRCMTCMDCMDKCRHGAIGYTFRRVKSSSTISEEERYGVSGEQVDQARRGFLSMAGLLAATVTLQAQEKKVDGGLAVIEEKKIPKRHTPIVPAGAQSIRNMMQHCTACQLCVSACPNNVLRPSTQLSTLMQPEISYERGYCRPECTRCSEVCPTGAIRLTTTADKSATQIGHAVFLPENCVVSRDEVICGNCARHCPVGAILMVPSVAGDPDSLQFPVVNTERCVGCGACENLCPARPFSAIYIEGHERHCLV